MARYNPRSFPAVRYPPGTPTVYQSCTRRTAHNHARKLNASSLPACEQCTVKGVPHHYHLGINGYVTTVHYTEASECTWDAQIWQPEA